MSSRSPKYVPVKKTKLKDTERKKKTKSITETTDQYDYDCSLDVKEISCALCCKRTVNYGKCGGCGKNICTMGASRCAISFWATGYTHPDDSRVNVLSFSSVCCPDCKD